MDNKTDLKAIMARFQPSEVSTNENASTPHGRPKNAMHPTLSSGPAIHMKKPVMESLSSSAINVPPKPVFLKNVTKSDTEVNELKITKALARRFANAQDDTSPTGKPDIISKQRVPMKPPLSQAPEAKGLGQKPPINRRPLCSTLSDSRPAFPKPSPAARPSWVSGDNGGGAPNSAAPKIPPLQRKPSSSIFKLREQNAEMAGDDRDTTNKTFPPANSTFKPTPNFKVAQNLFNREDRTEESERGVTEDGVKKLPLAAANCIPPSRPPASKKPSLKNPPKSLLQVSSVNDEATSGPKRKPLTNILALGPAPAKPNRPPKVDLENFKRGAEASDAVPGILKKPIIPTPLASHPSNHSNHMPPTPARPSLPPRHPGAMVQQDDFYDVVDEFCSPPPPLPPSTGHSQRAKEENGDDDEDAFDDDDDDDDGEMYEDLDERWEAAEQKQEKKDEREEKKRLEAEKKEQKEREKKEQDVRKKFKLVGPLEAIHQVKARLDCKGSKTDLGMKQGDCLDIIRVQGNPEGKWLGQTKDGCIGYVKITAVEIDFNTLKNCKLQQEYDPEVYDDIDVVSPDNSGRKGPGVALPPPPEEGRELYLDVIDENLEVRVPPPRQFAAEGSADIPGAAFDEIYDDVDSQNLPPPPPLSSLLALTGKNKTEELDPKKQKKMEKEEKEFRKKFKYEGEIQVLYQVTIVPSLTNKKWSGRELSVKAGERLDVIVKAVDDKLVCRNEEGKFGYVSTSHIVTDDGDIYDDIGDDSIYDND